MSEFIYLLTRDWEHINKVYSLSLAAQNFKTPSNIDEIHLAIALAFNAAGNVIILLSAACPNSLVLRFKGQQPKETLHRIFWGLVLTLKVDVIS